jgi:RND family efflux transporter MFP subunit
VVPVESKVFERTLSLPADLAAFQDVAIHARVPGFIESMAVDRGSTVGRGATLARIVAPELQAQLRAADAEAQTAESALAESRATLGAEQSTFERLTQAAKTPGVVAGNDLEVARQKVEAARARVEASTKTVDARREAARSLREVEGYLHVTAPFDGVVTERAAHVGSLVGPAPGPIVRMQQVDPLRLVAPIPEGQLGAAKVGQSVEFTVASFPGETFTARLARMARALDPGTRTMAVELDVDNRVGRLAPGMFAEVRWPVRREGTSLFVPRSAVAATTERIFVVRVRDGVAEWVDVKRGAALDNLIEVSGELSPGDQVALRATDELRSGTKVRATRQAGS